MGINIQQMAMNMIKNNPNIAKNKNAQAMIQAIQNNDAQAGEQIANNILQTYGKNKNDAIAEARQFFGV